MNNSVSFHCFPAVLLRISSYYVISSPTCYNNFTYVLLCRLTAFALGSFSEMAHFYGDASFIDEGVMSAAFNYLMKKQNKSGCFKLEGAVHNYRLLVCCAALTVET